MGRKELLGVFVLIIVLLGVMGIQQYKQTAGYLVEIVEDGNIYGSYELEEEKTIVLEIGNVVKIQEGQVFMESASCKNQLCVKQGKASYIGESIVCLPHKVVVQIHGE